MTKPVGVYRTKRPEGMEDDVWVEGPGISMDIPESRYRENQYEPDFDKLPWADGKAGS